MLTGTHTLVHTTTYVITRLRGHNKVEMESLKEKDWKRQQQESSGQRTNMFLTLQHLQGIFYILILAWAASVAVFLLELLRHRCSRR
ncbi:uncharacterized protein [Panulirus ornatus]